MSSQFEDYASNTFYYNGKKYYLLILFNSYNDLNNTYETVLNNSDIVSFEYVNELNCLYLKGEIVYKDQKGELDKYLEKNISYVEVRFVEVKEKIDSSIDVINLDTNTNFLHKFIIDKIKIENRQNSIITYRLSLVGYNWLKCIKNIHFTNYETTNNSKNKCTNIFNIISSILQSADLTINKDSFSYTNTELNINYITSQNDNVITAINYLLRRLYYYYDEASMKFLTYNEIDDNYGVLNIMNDSTVTNFSEIIISLFNTNYESFTQDEPNQLNSVTKFPKTYSIRSDFQKNIVSYDLNSNQFFTTSFSTKALNTFKNSRFNSNDIIEKYDYLENTLDYLDNGSYWNNDFDIYNSTLKTLLEGSSIVVNTCGDITRQPGGIVNINLDKNTSYINNSSLKDFKAYKYKYLTFNGEWFISKVRHIIYPNTLDTSTKAKYRQNIVLFRNFKYDVFTSNETPPTS